MVSQRGCAGKHEFLDRSFILVMPRSLLLYPLDLHRIVLVLSDSARFCRSRFMDESPSKDYDPTSQTSPRMKVPSLSLGFGPTHFLLISSSWSLFVVRSHQLIISLLDRVVRSLHLCRVWYETKAELFILSSWPACKSVSSLKTDRREVKIESGPFSAGGESYLVSESWSASKSLCW